MEYLRAVYCNWLEKNATKLIVDAEKEGYQKLVSSDLFGLHKNFSNSYTGYWRALTARFLIPHLIKSLYEIEHPAWLDRLYDAPISATPVTVGLAYRSLNERFSKNAENAQKEHDSFDGCLLECVRIILDAIVLDAKAMGSLIPINIDNSMDINDIFFRFDRSSQSSDMDDAEDGDENLVNPDVQALLQKVGSWSIEEVEDAFTSLSLFVSHHLNGKASGSRSKLHDCAWLILQLMPVSVLIWLMSASNERASKKNADPLFKKIEEILKCASGQCFYADLNCKQMVQVNRPSFIVKEARGNISRALSNRGPKSSPKVLWGTAYKDNEFQNAVTFVSEKEDSTGKLFNAILKNCQVQFDCWKNGIPEIFEFPVNKTINWMVFEQISGSLYVLDQSAHSYTDQDPIETWDSIRGSNLSLALHNIERVFDGFIAGNFLRKQETFEEMPVLGILCRCVIQLSKRYATKSLENQCVTSDDRSCYEIMTEDLEIAKANRLAPIAKRPVAGEEEDATAE